MAAKKDFLMFDGSECEDGLRDRDMYLVKGVADEDAARERLVAFFTEKEYTDCADDYACLCSGENMNVDVCTPACRMTIIV